MDQRKTIRINQFGPQPEVRPVPIVTRAINQEAWPGAVPLTPMAKPAPGSQFVSSPGPTPLAENLLRTRRVSPETDALVSPRMFYEMAKRYDEYPGENYEGS